VSQFILALLGGQFVSPLILRFDLIFSDQGALFLSKFRIAGLRNIYLKGGTSK
jgi:hypothetical protein